MEKEQLDSARITELLNKEKYMTLVLENIPEIILLLDREGRIDYCTEAVLEKTGIQSFEHIRRRSYRDFYRMIGDETFVENAGIRFEKLKRELKAMVNNISIDFSGRGEYRMYTVQATPLLDADDCFDGVIVMYYDATDLRNAEADERTRVMLDATPLACSFWDAEGNMLDCNQETLRMFGVAGKSDYVKYLYDLSPDFQPDGLPSKEKSAQVERKAFDTGYQRFEWMHRTLKGEPLPVETTLVRVPWKDGYGLATYSRDLREIMATQQKVREIDERNRELEVQTRAARVASEAKSQFLASMSHEIRTPMNAIIGMSDLIRTDNMDPDQKSFFEDIKKMSQTLLQIINDILDFSKIEAGKMELIPVHFDLLEMLEHICSMSRFMAESKGLEFRFSFDSNAPRFIVGDDARIRQIIVNIVNNAIKYTREGYVDLQVKRTAEAGLDYILFRVEDTGVGIKKENFGKLFGAFQQVDRVANHSIVGTGLGLSITQNLLTLMEGKIRLESEYGKGSVFTVLIPLTEGDLNQIEKSEFSHISLTAGEARVLVVDDSQINIKVAAAYLARYGIQSDAAPDGNEAIQMIKENSYDLVFMDHMMPEMDGIEATRFIRSMDGEKYRDLPIVALTANAVTGARETFLEAGMNDFIAKPINPESLGQMLLKWLPPGKISNVSGPAEREIPPRGAAKEDGNERENGNEKARIDLHAGLMNAAGDEDLYQQLMTDFQAGHTSDPRRIAEALRAGDVQTAYRLAHTLKSTAGLIGAANLSQLARGLEQLLMDGNADAAAERMEAIDAEMSAVAAELERLCPGRPEPEVKDAGQWDRQKGMSLIERLEPMLDAGNAASLDMVAEIEEVFAPLGEISGTLVKQIEDFEFGGALNTLRTIAEGFIK
ncbi:MAG: response regulator [Peptococcaceae bacterium]|jgi:signal transduction histidine kinase/DNA-binding NarL/FixJ family response regulator|nr:response regulator [Peptococcaceae bacterium]